MVMDHSASLKDWIMDVNSSKFGFELLIPWMISHRFEYEPWHYSYAPVSKKNIIPII
jgi:LAS superfamily LD-carboxypeptidase LdcB